jgi:hypothetical protein
MILTMSTKTQGAFEKTKKFIKDLEKIDLSKK